MKNSTSEYYHDELYNWSKSIVDYQTESEMLEARLFSIIRRNSVPSLANEAEQYMHQLVDLRANMDYLSQEINDQLTKISSEESAESLTVEIIDDQNALRNRVNELEKVFISAKQGCNDFLAKYQ